MRSSQTLSTSGPRDKFFEQLYKSYYSKLAAFASFYLNNDDAHDVVQEVFLSILERKNNQLNSESLNAYLYKSVQNKCMDVIRHKTTKSQYSSAAGQKFLETESEYFYASRNEIEDNLIQKELELLIESALQELPPKGREILNLYFEHRKSAKEISFIMGISQRTVESHIYTCIKTLRSKLSKYMLLFW